jgi:hypothetical protein
MSVRRHSCGARRQVVCGASQPIVGDGPQPFRRIKRRRRLQTGVQQAAAVNCMSRTYVTFGDIVGKLHVLRPECTRCARKGRYNVAKLIAQYGHRGRSLRPTRRCIRLWPSNESACGQSGLQPSRWPTEPGNSFTPSNVASMKTGRPGGTAPKERCEISRP